MIALLAETLCCNFPLCSGQIGRNPGLQAIWEDEKQRRRQRNQGSQIETPESQGEHIHSGNSSCLCFFHTSQRQTACAKSDLALVILSLDYKGASDTPTKTKCEFSTMKVKPTNPTSSTHSPPMTHPTALWVRKTNTEKTEPTNYLCCPRRLFVSC